MRRNLTPPDPENPAVSTALGGLGVAPQKSESPVSSLQPRTLRRASCAAEPASHGCTVRRNLTPPDPDNPAVSTALGGLGVAPQKSESPVSSLQPRTLRRASCAAEPASHGCTVRRNLTPPDPDNPAVSTALGGLGVAPQKSPSDGMRGSGGRPPDITAPQKSLPEDGVDQAVGVGRVDVAMGDDSPVPADERRVRLDAALGEAGGCLVP